MNRKTFFQKLGLAVGAAAVTKTVFASKYVPSLSRVDDNGIDNTGDDVHRLFTHPFCPTFSDRVNGNYPAYIDYLKNVLRSLGITERNITLFVGKKLYVKFENAALDYIKAYQNPDGYRDVSNYRNVFQKNGIVWYLHGLDNIHPESLIMKPGIPEIHNLYY